MQDILFDGQACSIIYFRDITYSFHYEQIMNHLKVEKLIQGRIENDI